MNPETRDLLAYLNDQLHETFTAEGRIDERRYLARNFTSELPLILSLQAYPGWRRLVGEHWMHWHDYYELFVALSGHGEVVVGSDRFPFSSGDIVLVDPLKMHGVVQMEESHTALVILFQSGAAAPKRSGLEQRFLDAWHRRPSRTLPRLRTDVAVAGTVHAAILNLARVWFEQESSPERLLTMKFHFLEMLFHLRQGFAAHHEPEQPHTNGHLKKTFRLRRTLEYVASNCHRTLGQTEVARTVGMSTSRFREFFKQTTGWGFGDYLRDLRLERAARLLRETDESVAAIAQGNGFSDQSHLQRMFKTKHGISPLAYRKRHWGNLATGEKFKK